MFRNSGSRHTSLVLRQSSIIVLLSSLILLLALVGCRGKSGSAPPSNVGGGFTLVASGGTLNDGSGVKGLSVLVTLRNSNGNGPGGAAGWQITITGPGINPPLVVSYDDASTGSYSTWWWDKFNPLSGTYTATASNVSTTLTYHFTIDATRSLAQPVLNKSGDVIFWNTVTGAGSYYYQVTDGAGLDVVPPGYINADPLQNYYSFQLPTVMDNGSYIVEVYALTKDRLALAIDSASSPALPTQENDSLESMDLVFGGTGSGYSLSARGGVFYEGAASGIDYFGLVIWTSLATNSTPSTPPAGDWNMTVTGPGITTPITFTYPRTYSQYVYWDFGSIPANPGIYTVSAIASGGTTTVSQTFTIPAATSKLPVATGLTVTPVSGGGANVSWSAVSGAKSYYVNVWTFAGGMYTEVAGAWVTSNSAVIQNKTLTKGAEYDIYITACELDMTDISSVPPADPGVQVDMSDTNFTYETIIAQ